MQGSIVNSISAPDLAVMEECKDAVEGNAQAVATSADWAQPATPAQEAEGRSKAAISQEPSSDSSPQEGHCTDFAASQAGDILLAEVSDANSFFMPTILFKLRIVN